MADAAASRLRQLRARIAAAAVAAGRTAQSVTLVGVSKGHGADAVRAMARLGVEHFGESYLQEALPKMDTLAPLELHWHFIGRLQANKTRGVAERFAWAHTVDRPRIATRLAAQRPPFAPPLNVCLQVKLTAAADRGGVPAAQLPALAAAVAALPQLRLRGLMCMLPEGLSAAAQGAQFEAVHGLLVALNRGGARLDTLSMGMSNDFEAAIGAGATLVRIGTTLFGSRNAPLGT
jgi:pyridoxal phosphate enzyme (YggS family)